MQADPLLAYVVHYWDHHGRESLNAADVYKQLADFVSGATNFPGASHANRSELLDLLTPLHILAHYNLPITLIPSESLRRDLPTPIFECPPFVPATWCGNVAMVRRLLAMECVLVDSTSIFEQPVFFCPQGTLTSDH